jgi:outer membrane protein
MKKILLISKSYIILLAVIIFLGGWQSGNCEDTKNPQKNAPIKSVLSLEEAIQYALVHNRSLNRAELGLTAGELSVNAQKAEFDLKIVPAVKVGYSSETEKAWQVGANVSKKLKSGVDLSFQPGIGKNNGETVAGVDVALNVPLLRGAGEAYAMDSVYGSLYSYEDAKLSYYSQQVGTVLQTVQAVYGSIESGLQVELLEKQLASLNEHLALAKIKEKAGIVSAIDLYRAEIRIKTVQEELTSLREEYANTIGVVKSLLAIPQSGEVTITAPVEYKPITIDLEEAIAIAQNNRIEVEQSRRLVVETQRQLALAKNNLLPQLDLQLGYNRSGTDTTFDFSDESYTASLNSTTDLFRTVEKSAYLQKQIQFKQIVLDQESEKENISQQVRSEINTLEKQQQRIALREEQLMQTTGKMQLAESKFRNGMADNFDLIEAQAQMQEAETNRLVERIGYIIRTYQLRSTLGTLLERKVTQ